MFKFNMSRQLSLENYFSKSKAGMNSSQSANLRTSDGTVKYKRRNLSLRNPSALSKSPKIGLDNRNVPAVVNLCSDEEDARPPSAPSLNLSQSTTNGESSSTASDTTVLYSLTPESPKTTPQKSVTLSQNSQSFRSPQSREKYFSPVKNRSVLKRASATKVKRSLSMEMSNETQESVDDALFTEACKDMDHKTIFLLTIINKFLTDESLRQLLDSDARALFTRCLEVAKPGMRLVCRLYWRKEGWYKREQVNQISSDNKPLDDPIFEAMMQSLVESGLVTMGTDYTMGFEEFKKILNKDELVQACRELKLKVSSKQDAIGALDSFSRGTSNISTFFTGRKSSNAGRVLKILSAKAGRCYKLSESARAALRALHVLMYLGMDYGIIRDKKLELTLLYDKIQRETFPVDKRMVLDNASVVFKSAEEFERYLTAHYVNEDFLNETDCANKCSTVKQVYTLYKEIGHDEMMGYKTLPPWLRRFTPAYIYVKILEAGIQDLKKDKDGGHCLLALDVLTALIAQNEFRQHKKAEWYAEKALILHSLLYRCDEAAEVLLQGFRSDLSEEAKDRMRPRALKIANMKSAPIDERLKRELLQHATKEHILEKNLAGEHIYKQPMDRTSKRGKVKFETRTTEGRMVQDAEEYCIAHYICNYGFTDGEHWEGRIVTTIFFLLFWDIIYTKPGGVAGVFLSRFQQFPLDLFSTSFYENRRAAIDEWLAAIERSSEEKLLGIMRDTWNSRPESELSGVHRGLGWEKVREVAQCLGPLALAALCRRLATDYSYAHSGFPDLTLWNKHTKKIKFVEVKTDSDKPSMKQIQWMNYLREHDIDTEFCYVGVNTTRQRSRTGATPQTKVKKEPRRRIKKEKAMKPKITASHNTINITEEIDVEVKEPGDAGRETLAHLPSRVKVKPNTDDRRRIKKEKAIKPKSTASHNTINSAEEIDVEVKEPGDAERDTLSPLPSRVNVEPNTDEIELEGSIKTELTSSQSPVKESKNASMTEISFQARVKTEPEDAEMEVTSTEDTLKKKPTGFNNTAVSSSQEIVKRELLNEAITPNASQCY